MGILNQMVSDNSLMDSENLVTGKKQQKNNEEEEDNDKNKSTTTKSGLPRKRRPPMSKQEKQEIADANLRRKIDIAMGRLSGCESEICTFRCTEKIPPTRRLEILTDYMHMTSMERKIYVLNLCERSTTQKNPNKTKRKNFFKYFLLPTKKSYEKQQVCQIFFINTLGYSKSNGKTVYNLLRKTPNNGIPLPRLSGKHEPANKFKHHQLVIDHIDSYDPKYRGKKTSTARRYLPADVTMKDMHQNFMEKHPDIVISYRLYCSIVKQQNVSFQWPKPKSSFSTTKYEEKNSTQSNNNTETSKKKSKTSKKNRKKKSKSKTKKSVEDEDQEEEEFSGADE